MPAQRTQCEEGGAASVSTSVNRESVYPHVRHTRSYGHKKNKSICRATNGTESSHSGPVGASGLWSLLTIHWFIDQSSSLHITDVRMKHIGLNVRIRNAFMCTNKWIRGIYTAWARDQTVRSINKGHSWPSWEQIKAFPDSRIDWLILLSLCSCLISWHWASKTIDVLGRPGARSSELADLHLQPFLQKQPCMSNPLLTWKRTKSLEWIWLQQDFFHNHFKGGGVFLSVSTS